MVRKLSNDLMVDEDKKDCITEIMVHVGINPAIDSWRYQQYHAFLHGSYFKNFKKINYNGL